MSKVFKYLIKTGELTDRNGDYDGDDGFDFEYEVSDEQLEEALVDLVFDCYFSTKDHELTFSSVMCGIKKFIRDYEGVDFLFEDFEDLLKDYFEEDAQFCALER